MSEPFLAEIRIFGFSIAPRGWAFCDGQIMSIQQNTALFSLLGTYYGGNGQTNFALPNFQGTVPMHWGNGAGLSPYVIGETIGSPNVNLLQSEMPMHNHVIEDRDPQQGPGHRHAGADDMAGRLLAGQAVQRSGAFAVGDVLAQGDLADGRQPAAREHAALSGAQFLHRARGYLSGAQLTRVRRDVAVRCLRTSRRTAVAGLCPAAGARGGYSVSVPALRLDPRGRGGAGRRVDAGAEGRLPCDAIRRSAPPLPDPHPRLRLAGAGHRGEPMGRLYLENRVSRLHVVDIALLPAWRGSGVGSAILKALIALAQAQGKGVGISSRNSIRRYASIAVSVSARCRIPTSIWRWNGARIS